MKIVVRVLLVVLITLLVATPLVAQELPAGDARNTEFRNHILEIVGSNPTIYDFNRMLVGTKYQLPSGGSDILEDGDRNGIWGREFRKFYGVPYEDFLARKVVPIPTPLPMVPPVVMTFAPMSPDIPVRVVRDFDWAWGVAALVVLLFCVLIFLGWWLVDRPTSWRPVVPGGATNDRHAVELLTQQATRRHATLVQGSQERVRLHGFWAVRHAGVPVPVPHRYNAERAWRARFRMENGTECVGYMLQGCGNDVVFGGAWYSALPGARVEEGWGEEPIVVPTPVLVSTPTVPEPTPAPVPLTPDVVPEPEPTQVEPISVEYRKGTADQPALIQVKGSVRRLSFTIDNSGVTFRCK